MMPLYVFVIFVAAFLVLPAFIGALIAYGMRAIQSRRVTPRKRNIKRKPDLLKAVRLGQTILM